MPGRYLHLAPFPIPQFYYAFRRRQYYQANARWSSRSVARLPTLARGWTTGPPDFVGVGVQRGGTTWWYGLLVAHPQIVENAVAKETRYLERFWHDEFGEAEVAHYHSLFPRPAGSISGEWTPHYIWEFWVPPLLKQAAADARILVMLRDPIERYLSGFAITFPPVASQGFSAAMVAHTASEWGLYSDQLRRWFRFFSRDRVLVLQYEACVANPREQLARTYAFLGVDPSFVPEGVTRLRSPTGNRRPPLPGLVAAALREAYRVDAAELAVLVPEIDLTLWKTIG